MKTSKIALLILVLAVTLTNTACWTAPEQGQVEVQTIWGQVTKVVRPPGIWTIFAFGDEYHKVDLRSRTLQVDIRASSKEPANFVMKGQLVVSLLDDDKSIIAHVTKFGLSPEERETRLIPQLLAYFQTAYLNAAANYDAYTLVASQEAIQRATFEQLLPKFEKDFNLKLDSVQFLGKPDFENDDIDLAASRVVASQKAKEAAEAMLAAKRIEVETKQLDAQTYSNPQLLKLEELKLQKEIAEAWAKHQGSLSFGSGNPFFPNK